MMTETADDTEEKAGLPGWVVKVALLLVIIGVVAANYFNALDPLKTLLSAEEMTLTIKQVSITPYLVLRIVFVLTVLIWAGAVLSGWASTYIGSLERLNANTRILLSKLIQIVIFTLIFFIGLEALGISITALTVFGGALGIGLGFGLQKIASNFISGLILLYEKSIQAGDLVELDDGTLGIVTHTSSRYTLVSAYEGKEIMIPNEDFITSRVVNWTYSNDKARIEIRIGVEHGSDVDKVHDLMMQAAQNQEATLSDPPPQCFLDQFSDSAVHFILYFWIDNVKDGRLRHRSGVMFDIVRLFRENGIRIAHAQHDIYVKSENGMTDDGPPQA